MNILVYTIALFLLSACGKSGSGPVTANTKAPAVQPSNPSGGAGGTDPVLTYYTLVVNETVTQGGSSYPVTVTGHCVNYNSEDYCWDDGWQTNPGLTNYETDFWGLCDNGGMIGQCSGGSSTDPVVTPYTWTSMSGYLTTPPHTPTEVYASGIATNVNCTVTGTQVDCGDFSFDTSSATL